MEQRRGVVNTNDEPESNVLPVVPKLRSKTKQQEKLGYFINIYLYYFTTK